MDSHPHTQHSSAPPARSGHPENIPSTPSPFSSNPISPSDRNGTPLRAWPSRDQPLVDYFHTSHPPLSPSKLTPFPTKSSMDSSAQQSSTSALMNLAAHSVPSPPAGNAYTHHSILEQEHGISPFNESPPFTLPQAPSSQGLAASLGSTLTMGDLEPWMDEAYGLQVCALMGWEGVSITVPPVPQSESYAVPADPNNPQSRFLQPNNPGFLFLTFPSHALAAQVFSQLTPSSTNPPVTMPNSKRSFNISWPNPTTLLSALSVPTNSNGQDGTLSLNNGQQISVRTDRPHEFSIFVGDLAPETTNSDLVAVFRDPILGLRNDREPRYIRPFLSCKSAKIMMDPATGMSRGYGFVRFSDEADQQRALIEMQGLYCLSRPMRISHATAKAKALASSLPQIQTNGPALSSFNPSNPHRAMPLTPAPSVPQDLDNLSSLNAPQIRQRSVSSPVANPEYSTGASSGQGLAPSVSAPLMPQPPLQQQQQQQQQPALSTSSSASLSQPKPSEAAQTALDISPTVLAQLAQIANTTLGSDSRGRTPSDLSQGQRGEERSPAQLQYLQQQQSQARALLANIVGPNGGVLNSTDPYNTTVFVGGLSGLISEETLRSFFAPFGEIHYVKIPPGKGCGFVQFVRKADAERAIERMQGFPIGGGRVRLSWGRSQSDKAAQAAVQAAQLGLNLGALGSLNGLSLSHTAQLLQSLGMASAKAPSVLPSANGVGEGDLAGASTSASQSYGGGIGVDGAQSDAYSNGNLSAATTAVSDSHAYPGFSPFSPDPNPGSAGFQAHNVPSITLSKTAPGAYSIHDAYSTHAMVDPRFNQQHIPGYGSTQAGYGGFVPSSYPGSYSVDIQEQLLASRVSHNDVLGRRGSHPGFDELERSFSGLNVSRAPTYGSLQDAMYQPSVPRYAHDVAFDRPRSNTGYGTISANAQSPSNDSHNMSPVGRAA
ncbi:hypothetical protein BOTBODRAFT_173845 [Botryobasidium botryosum FD-172 SS1]|uniref:RRM domain-containing protein n=1 Tax=Botryobasidium botryosum (strain FD-172 SS1) TaxID=930990 RepID=A0A067MUZ1_BOTB1|nr:hypothetical protein BOTBODRAFT_173845 [Botryobasidium botryosum FD-172 SS1]